MSDARRVAVGLGGNLGGVAAVADRFRQALSALGTGDGPLRELRLALLYRTEPVPLPGAVPIEQPDFVNSVAVGRLRDDLKPDADAVRLLVGWCKRLEAAAGRDAAAPRGGPRPLDLDLLLLGEMQASLPPLAGDGPGWPGEIVVPHPRLAERRFVLQPLADLLPELVIPGLGVTVVECLASLPPGQQVEPLSAADTSGSLSPSGRGLG